MATTKMAALTPTAPTRTFFPRSRVLLERRPVTFDSDNEDDEEQPAPLPPPTPLRPTGSETVAIAISEIAFVHEGRVENARFDLPSDELAQALQSLPRDAWTTLLDANDRRRLAAHLPSLEGWNDMPSEDAQRAAVEALLARENLHFGNPLTALEESLRSGQCTRQATQAREVYKKQTMAHFALERETTLRTRQESLEKKKAQDEEAQSEDLTPQWKKIRLSSDFPFIHRKEPIDSNGTALVSEQTSIFLALRSILANVNLRIDVIVEKLRSNFPQQSTSAANSLPLFLPFDKYIKAALTFLSGEHVSADSTHWSTAVFVQFNPESEQYEWCSSEHIDTGFESLLLLEQVFRAPVASNFLDCTNDSSGVKATRKRRERILTQRARDALLASDASFAALDAYQKSRPSEQLKRSLLGREASPSIRSGRAAFEQS